ncbi:MAG: hypothetical protein R3Y09_13020 [Clostridia bacterium]
MYIERCTHGSEGSVWKTTIVIWQVAGCLPYYPDGLYTVNSWVIDTWTPVGMLSLNLTDNLNIDGNLWDDWHIAVK